MSEDVDKMSEDDQQMSEGGDDMSADIQVISKGKKQIIEEDQEMEVTIGMSVKYVVYTYNSYSCLYNYICCLYVNVKLPYIHLGQILMNLLL
jgi:hypothetical protein